VARDGSAYLYVLREDRAILTKVETGARLADLVAVRGVKPGERVALRPLDKLSDGARVKPLQK